jgi:hypothetical protein
VSDADPRADDDRLGISEVKRKRRCRNRSAIEGTCDSKRLAQTARACAEVPGSDLAPAFGHDLQIPHRLEGADEDCAARRRGVAHDIQTPVQAIDSIDIR